MAGIGFRLDRLLRSDEVYDRLLGVFASLVISAGPWLSAMGAIFLMSTMASPSDAVVGVDQLVATVSYCYMISMLVFSPLEMIMTRYIADALYVRDYGKLTSLFVLLTLVVQGLAGVAAAALFFGGGLRGIAAWTSVMLVVATAGIWVAMIFVSACREYGRIMAAFLGGNSLAIVCAYGFGVVAGRGNVGILIGFAFGQVAIFALLGVSVLRAFGGDLQTPRGLPQYFARHRRLVGIGFLATLVIWVDKWIVWSDPTLGSAVAPLFHRSLLYDASTFLATLIIIPVGALFLAKVETDFYVRTRRLLTLVEGKASLEKIDLASADLRAGVRRSGLVIVGLELLLVAAGIVTTRFFPDALGLSGAQARVFGFAVVACSLHMLTLIMNILMLYFDQSRAVLRNYMIFAGANAALTLLTARLTPSYLGAGYLVAAALAAGVSAVSLRRTLHDLMFLILMCKPEKGVFHDAPLLLEQLKPMESEAAGA